MAVAVLVTRLALVHAGATALERLVVAVFVGIVVFLPACARLVPEVLEELRRLRRSRPALVAPLPDGAA
jgi:hypothetical protein